MAHKMHLSDLTPDPANANKHTQRGTGMLERSLRQYGAGRSILLDKDNNVLCGNATVEGAAAIGLEDVIVVDSDGSKLVAVRRTDLHIDSKQARELAIADNRVAQVNLAWDAEQLAAELSAGLDLSGFWSEQELQPLLTPPIVDTTPVFQPTVTPETATSMTSEADMARARKDLEAKFAAQIALKPVVCPYCAGEFFLDKDKTT